MKKTGLVVLLLVLFGLGAKAQNPFQKDTVQLTYKGLVLKADSGAAPGAFVSFKGRIKSSSTDSTGRFVITGNTKDSLLLITFPGHETEEVRVPFDTSESITIRLRLTPSYINIGYGRQVVQHVSTPLGQVTGAQLNQQVITSFEQGLQGKLAGVMVTQSSGIPTASSQILIRGNTSLYAGSEPLIVLDGIPLTTGTFGDGGGTIGLTYGYQTSVLSEINPADIESIEVLKDAGATAIYGARGGNGVIQINTKRGEPGKTRFNLNYYSGISQATKSSIDLLDGPTYQRTTDQAWQRSFPGQPLPTDRAYQNAGDNTAFTPTNTNWLDKALRNGAVNQVDLSASGGNKSVNFYLGASYRNEKGVIPNSNYDRLSLRFNADNKATDNLRIGLSTYINYSVNHLGSAGKDTIGGFGTAQYRSLPHQPINYPSGQVNPYPFNPFFNPYRGTNLEVTNNRDYYDNQRNTFRNVANLYVNLDLFKSSLKRDKLWFRSDLGVDYLTTTDRQYRSRYLRRVPVQVPSRGSSTPDSTLYEATTSASDYRSIYTNLSFSNTLNYQFNWAEDHSLTLTGGNHWTQTIHTFNGTSSENFPNDYSRQVSAGALPQGLPIGSQTGFAFQGLFARANWAFRNKYFVGASLRTDLSSRFGDEAGMGGYGFFPGVSAKWAISQEAFFPQQAWLNDLKLRASAGRSGNSQFGNELKNGFWRGGDVYTDPSTFYPGRLPYSLANPNLSWENIDQFDVGFEAAFLGNRLTAQVDYYHKINRNTLALFGLPASLGMAYPFLAENLMSVRANGLEVTLHSENIRKGDFRWSTDLNLTFQASKVLDVNDGVGVYATANGDNGEIRVVEGREPGVFYLARHAGRDANGNELILDANGRAFRPERVSQIDSAAVAISDKSRLPKYFGALTNTLGYKNWEMSFTFVFVGGHYILDEGERLQSYVTGGNNLRQDAINSGYNLYYNGNGYLDPLSQRNTDRFLHKADYVRLRNLSIAYNLSPQASKAVGFSRVRVYLMAQNLLTFTAYKGWDPEVLSNGGSAQARNLSMGLTTFDAPQVRSFVAGINLGF